MMFNDFGNDVLLFIIANLIKNYCGSTNAND